MMPSRTVSYEAAASRYENSAFYRRCGRSGLKLPLISLGLWQNMGRTTALPRQLLPALAAGLVGADLLFLTFGPLPADASLSLQMILGWMH